MVTLFDVPAGRVRHGDPETSVHAGRRARQSMTQAILDSFARRGPLTDDELASALPHYPSPSLKTARSRLSKSKPPRLVWSGDKRPSNTGSPMLVWKLRFQPPRSADTTRDPA